MNRQKIVKKSILIATVGILALGIIPAVSAGPPGFVPEFDYWVNLAMPFFAGDWDWENPPYEYQYAYWPFNSSWNIAFWVGWGTFWEEMENDLIPKWPYEVKLYINNVEIPLQEYAVPIPKFWQLPDREILAKVVYWYHIFGPGYFTAGGEYLLRWEFWVRRPYQNDGLNHWRIFVDYWGYISPPGAVYSFEYPLNFVA
ncbi:MAG: hypothetical protein ACFFA7_13350 [Promethearchaeota archaeon]